MKTRFVPASLVLFLVVIGLFSVIPSAFAPYHSNQSGITVSTDKSSYSEGDTIHISGSVSDYVSYDVTIQILNPLGKTVVVDEVEPSSDGTYSTNLLASGAVWKLDGTYTVKITHIVGTAKTTFEFLVSGVPPLGVDVVIPAGSSMPGCEETNECFLPYRVTINVGDRVTWTNMDSFFHTLASGTTQEGPDGIFMSQMLSPGDRFSHTFTATGNYVYFDMQNPWMTGVVIVGEAMVEEPMVTAPSLQIPDWIKNNAGWWAEGQIGDSDFVSGIQYMIKENIMVIPDLPEEDTRMKLKDEKRAMGLERDINVPDWVRNNAGWWADGVISENDFVNGIKYLVEHGIIRV